MEVLGKEEITSELAETILDKVHLAMSKENPDWQAWAMDEEGEEWKEIELKSLSRTCFLHVLKNSSKELSTEATKKLAKEFKSLGAIFLSDFLIERSERKIEEENKHTEKSYCQSAISNVSKSNPTPSQIRAGNYKKTHIWFRGLPISIENKKGSYRTGSDSQGNTWKNKIHYDYGYLKRTKGADGDHVDVFVGPDNESDVVFVINQKNKVGSFDEHKVMLGFHDEKAARAGYLKNYSKNWKGLGSVVTLTLSQFKEWLEKGDTKRELKNPKIEFLKSGLLQVRKNAQEIQFLKSGLDENPFQILKSEKFQYEFNFQDSDFISLSEDQKLFLQVRKSNKETRSALDGIVKADLGRPADMVGTKKVWNDGLTHEKEEHGWKIVSVPVTKKEEKEKPKRKSRKSPERPKKGPTIPTSLPFPKIRVIEQYTAKKNYDRSQIDSLKILIEKNGYDPAFPMCVDFKDNEWTVVAGHHRYEAVRELIEEGKLSPNVEIPVVVKEFASNNKRLAAQLSENQRRIVNPTDEVKAYAKMIEEGWDEKRISEEMGKKLGEIQKRLSLTNLSPELFSLIEKKDKSLPLGIAEVIGTFCKDANGKPNHTIQIRAFKWYQENRSKYGSRGPSVLQNYIKELQSGEFENFDFDSVATNVQKEAQRIIQSREKASANRKMLQVMVENLMKTYNRVLGDNVTSLSPDVSNELAASLALTSETGVGSVAILAQLGVVIQDLTIIKNSIHSKLKEIEDNSSIPMLFARSYLADIEEAIELSNVLKSEFAEAA
ncbi:ParB N-terminal domain-containing protein [Leptospira kmetyi]|uniref:Chromosome partitioning protein ParB n=1 Tax=Leptospira kmetyi TaxID=408139 RepID=A0ABX4N6V6_9LEPT|nr:ParB N-terminal domain-containing protein [Leptospira kmetyi]PJZ29076.1 chromosome partitioning protein ParB [Leptospira kmetyi]PJZ39759.1 chromosome partitioning protein ParB [Leptospira kmetyi]